MEGGRWAWSAAAAEAEGGAQLAATGGRSVATHSEVSSPTVQPQSEAVSGPQ